ncbi:MAG: hypothetical protein NVSMB4_02680 [Acidimicrobiales bacterium]
MGQIVGQRRAPETASGSLTGDTAEVSPQVKRYARPVQATDAHVQRGFLNRVSQVRILLGALS